MDIGEPHAGGYINGGMPITILIPMEKCILIQLIVDISHPAPFLLVHVSVSTVALAFYSWLQLSQSYRPFPAYYGCTQSTTSVQGYDHIFGLGFFPVPL